MHKFFVDKNQIQNDKVHIIGSDINHIANVLRLKIDDEIQICSIEDEKNYITKIIQCNREIVICKIVQEINTSTEPKVKIDIFQGIPKADKMELIIQKTTEIGVRNIIPVLMERSIVKLTKKDEEKKIERWQKISEVAAKQSKRDIIPKVEKCIDIKEVQKRMDNYTKFIVAYEQENRKTLKQVLKELKNQENIKIGVLIGPEGGIDEKEIQILKHRADIVTLGSRILRTETAPIVVVSNTIYELEN